MDKIRAAYKSSTNIYDDVLTQGKWWSRLYMRLFWGVDDMEIAHKLLQMLQDDFNSELLDVPCGTLNLTAEKYRKMRQSRITCIDYSADMLAQAKTRIKEGKLSHVSAMQGDVGNLPFADASFDTVLSMNGFHAFPNKERAYVETARVLKPGGIFLGCFYIRGECRRSDFVVNTVLAKRGWFTPPFQTKDDVITVLKKHYSKVELFTENAMLWFRCMK